ncbi:serine/threonine-protein kinase [Streptomyces sp. NPDC018352]|uniref:serine/threonine-protein kinase n=1 Tax=Streptomyces sp. NPDC018352 TaxID=3157194 RepID=UPI0033F43B1D
MQGVLLAERFRIKDRLGAGGMGEVWSAQDERMRRGVAVKLVRALPSVDESETRARFQREVQLAGRLSHQNIVTVHDFGEVPVSGHQTLYLVMELVPGISLRQRLKKSTPPWPMAVGWAVQITQALHAAHLQGIVHRDIKPANVLLTPAGTAKVLDFGVAKFMGDTEITQALTATGAVLGSPPYMSPEQAEGVREIDHRTDLYSLGCLLYDAVTGRPPFDGHHPMAVLRMHLDETPTEPGALVEGLPGPLNDLIMSLLAKRPDDRPSNAADVHDTLCTVLIDHATTLPGGNLLDVVQLGHADSLAARFLKESWQVWLRTQTRSASKLEKADALFAEAEAHLEATRTEAVEAAAESEARLAEVRKQAEQTDRELAAQRAEAENKLAETESRTERLRWETEQMRTDAERQGERVVEKARLQAADIVAAAKAEAARILIETVRERTARSGVAGRGTDGSPFGFELVRRGYDRARVDDYISRLVADRDSKLAQVVTLEESVRDLHYFASLEGRRDSSPAAEARRRAAGAAAADVRAQRSGMVGPPPGFELVRRGYDRAQVDERISELVADRDRANHRIGPLVEWIERLCSPPA